MHHQFQVEISLVSIKTFFGFCVPFFIMISNFFVLEKEKQKIDNSGTSENFINIYNEESSHVHDTSFTTFPSNESNISHSDDDNNNDSNNTTPTLNHHHIPRVFTPEIKIVNSTPLNHFNHQNGLSNRKFRRDLTKSR